MPVLSLMAAVTFHSLLFFVNFWSADANLVIAFSKLSADQIEKCSHVWVRVINKKQDTIKRHIEPIMILSHEIEPGNLQTVHSIELLKKRMLWNVNKRTFLSIPFPVK